LEISHQFYSLDLPPAIFFLFSKEINGPQRKIILVLRKHQGLDCSAFVVAEWDVIWVILCLYTILNQLYILVFSHFFFRRLEIFPKKVYSCSAYLPFLPIFEYPDNGMVPVSNTSTFLFHSMHLSSHGTAFYHI